MRTALIALLFASVSACAKKPAPAAPKADKVEKPADPSSPAGSPAPAPTDQKSDPCEGGEQPKQ